MKKNQNNNSLIWGFLPLPVRDLLLSRTVALMIWVLASFFIIPSRVLDALRRFRKK